jgi:hypothetical protein
MALICLNTIANFSLLNQVDISKNEQKEDWFLALNRKPTLPSLSDLSLTVTL